MDYISSPSYNKDDIRLILTADKYQELVDYYLDKIIWASSYHQEELSKNMITYKDEIEFSEDSLRMLETANDVRIKEKKIVWLRFNPSNNYIKSHEAFNNPESK